MDANPVKLPPNFDIRAQSAASKWKAWKCMFEDYLIGIGQDEAGDKIKLSLLRNMMGPESTKVVQSFKISQKDSTNYTKVIEEIEKYVNPKCNEVFERYKFNERRQEEGESFENYYTSLRQLIENCNYNSTASPIEDQLLRDRIVQGISDKGLQESLLRMDNLTLDKAAHRCRASEISRSQVKEMNPTVEIDAVKHNYTKEKNASSKMENTRDNKFHCRRCQKMHGPRECLAYGKKCTRCGILNHFAVSCKVRNVGEAKCANSSVQVKCSVNNTEFSEYIQIENQSFKCKLDTGAEISILPKKLFDSLNQESRLKLYNTDINVQSFSGENVKPHGIINLNCQFKDKICYENFVVVDTNALLLGLPGCVSLGLVRRIHTVETQDKKENVIKDNIKVFEEVRVARVRSQSSQSMKSG